MAPTPAMETTASELGTAHGTQQQQMTTTQLQMPTTQQLQQMWLMLQGGRPTNPIAQMTQQQQRLTLKEQPEVPTQPRNNTNPLQQQQIQKSLHHQDHAEIEQEQLEHIKGRLVDNMKASTNKTSKKTTSKSTKKDNATEKTTNETDSSPSSGTSNGKTKASNESTWKTKKQTMEIPDYSDDETSVNDGVDYTLPENYEVKKFIGHQEKHNKKNKGAMIYLYTR